MFCVGDMLGGEDRSAVGCGVQAMALVRHSLYKTLGTSEKRPARKRASRIRGLQRHGLFKAYRSEPVVGRLDALEKTS